MFAGVRLSELDTKYKFPGLLGQDVSHTVIISHIPIFIPDKINKSCLWPLAIISNTNFNFNSACQFK